jgi:sporulation protein YtfJ
MEKHAIESIMTTTMESIRDMVDVNTVVGEPITASDGTTVIPISRVSFGFVAGGGEYDIPGKKPAGGQGANGQGAAAQGASEPMPFAGGAGAGVSVTPVGFLAVNGEQVRLLPAQPYAPLDRIIELAPQLVQDVKRWMGKKDQAPPPAPAVPMPPTGPLD